MILIISNNTDASTNNVIDWLDYYQIPWFRINEDDKIEIIKLQLHNSREPEVNILVNGKELCLKDITGYWYRRGLLNIQIPLIKTEDYFINAHVQYHVSNEIKYAANFIYHYLATYKKSLSNYLTAENNKLKYLLLASESGLEIPDTLICNSSNELNTFSNDIITKSIHELISIAFEDVILGSRTYLISDEILNDETFLLSLFQKNIHKMFELRIFFILNEMYTMAIFSQENEQTKIDFRNYDETRPNRRVPYKLPDEIEKKIYLFIEKSGLNSGSIDMIVTPSMRYVFLEINPIGQFGMVSYPCNYFLEEKIAKYLSYE